jgi:glycosyltransferase involved in cell wall biosynthesis
MTVREQTGSLGKVLIVVENLSVPFDRRVWRECQALRDAGYQVSALSPMGIGRDSRWHEELDGISVFRYPIFHAGGSFLSYIGEYFSAMLMTFLLMWVVLVRRGFDVVQICNPPDLLIFPVLPFKWFGKKVIFDQHDLCPEIYETQKGLHGRPNAVVRVLLRLEALTYAWSDVIMVVNDSCRRIAVGRRGRSERDVFVVRNGPSLQNIQHVKPNKALKHGRRHLLTYVGMMGPQEGIDVLLRAIHRLVNVHGRDDFHVQILGGGTVLEAMQAYARELGLSDRVTFTGSVEYARVMEGIASADLCLCPDPKTPLSDKCSLVKAIEYMSLGRAFVAFDLEEVRLSAGSAAEYATPGDEADFAARIHRLLDDPERRAEMGRRGREQVLQRLTWEHAKESLFAAYEHAFSKKKSATIGVQLK